MLVFVKYDTMGIRIVNKGSKWSKFMVIIHSKQIQKAQDKMANARC